MSLCLILLAAGKSNRFKSNLSKPYHKIAGKTLLEISLKKTLGFKPIKKTIIVYNLKNLKLLKKMNLYNVKLIKGGATRQESTLNALKYLIKRKEISKVIIHDAARPNFSITLLKKISQKIKKSRAVIPILKIQDAVKQKIQSSKFEYIVSKDRKNLFTTQTPQAFNLKEIYTHHLVNKLKYRDDDISLYMNLNNVNFIQGEKNNFKITDQNDFENFKKLSQTNTYMGIGFDVHRLVPNRKLFLAGLKVKSKLGTLGHSDGDPVLHSIIDSILGACKMGDIGQLFSDKDNKFKNIRSTILLEKVIKQINLKGFYINNIDINIIAQTPKIKNLKNSMINNIAKLCKISKEQINIKGKTTEKLGVIGKEKAIACEVITSVVKYEL